MAANNNAKIDSLKRKIKAIDEKMKSLLVQKKDCERQLKEIEQEEFMSIINENGYTISTLRDDLKLAKLLKENDITQDDVLELVGGIKNESNNQP
ncbi:MULTISPECIES: hypothetical protein [unclassified Ruminococcus]|uniref:hypothetical protein n=1 Tax=unclassified Ruminococcus TaxID=2608920 RepID=UPI00210DD3A6|nr:MULTISPECIES: hypothetical protein [unclassified Ruminococcus]MCQ4021744.1 hypothetical protein [Ruminococcus sp. zg-924]MCQ4114188.1 hypothetical protein [Ruminococcus sp. zg-921]